MAALSAQDIDGIWAEYQRRCSTLGIAIRVNKADLRAFFVAADGWIDANMTAFNTAIPQPARNAMATPEKVLGFVMVVERRWNVGA